MPQYGKPAPTFKSKALNFYTKSTAVHVTMTLTTKEHSIPPYLTPLVQFSRDALQPLFYTEVQLLKLGLGQMFECSNIHSFSYYS